jgi:cobalt-zinc-cadmium efflux system outer membrane protein
MIRSSTLVFGLALMGAYGCATMKPQLGFDGVQADVASRSSLRVHWGTGSSADAEVRSAVASMLERELSPGDAVQIALLNNRDLQAEYEQLNLAQADLVKAGLLRNPIFDAAIRFGEGGSGTGIELGLLQDFLSILYIPMRKQRAEASFEAAKLRVTIAVLDLAREVRIALIELQTAQQTLEMRSTVLEATQASYELAKRLREAGNITELDLSNERALYEQAKVDLASAEAVAMQLREPLNDLMGLWGAQTQWRIANRLPEIVPYGLDSDDLERRVIEESLDLAIARQEIEIAARALDIAKPLGLFNEAEVGVDAEKEIEGEWSVGPAFALPIPLFDQGQAAVASAQAQLKQSMEQYTALAIRIRSRVRSSQAAMRAAGELVAYYENVILPLRQKIVDETQLQYNAMQVSPFQLLQAKRDQIDAGVQYIQALRNYWLSRTQLDQLAAGRLVPASQGISGSIEASRSPTIATGGDH